MIHSSLPPCSEQSFIEIPRESRVFNIDNHDSIVNIRFDCWSGDNLNISQQWLLYKYVTNYLISHYDYLILS
jgi:hypothetical protein